MRNVLLGNRDIAKLIADLRRTQRILEKVVNEAEKEIAAFAKQTMLSKAPTQDVDGNIPGRVVVEKTKLGYSVSYKGKDVAYIEFGTGVNGVQSPYPDSEILARVNWMYDINGHGPSGWFYYSKRDGKLRYSRGGVVGERPVFETVMETEEVADSIIEMVVNEKLGG